MKYTSRLTDSLVMIFQKNILTELIEQLK